MVSDEEEKMSVGSGGSFRDQRFRRLMVSNAQLHNDKSSLVYQVETLREELSNMEEELWESRRHSDHASKEFERERQTHTLLQFQFKEMKETLRQTEELLTKHGVSVVCPETSNGETSREETGRVETGRVETSREETGRVETGRVETGREETGRVETSRVETGRDYVGSRLAQEPSMLGGAVRRRPPGGSKLHNINKPPQARNVLRSRKNKRVNRRHQDVLLGDKGSVGVVPPGAARDHQESKVVTRWTEQKQNLSEVVGDLSDGTGLRHKEPEETRKTVPAPPLVSSRMLTDRVRSEGSVQNLLRAFIKNPRFVSDISRLVPEILGTLDLSEPEEMGSLEEDEPEPGTEPGTEPGAELEGREGVGRRGSEPQNHDDGVKEEVQEEFVFLDSYFDVAAETRADESSSGSGSRSRSGSGLGSGERQSSKIRRLLGEVVTEFVLMRFHDGRMLEDVDVCEEAEEATATQPATQPAMQPATQPVLEFVVEDVDVVMVRGRRRDQKSHCHVS